MSKRFINTVTCLFNGSWESSVSALLMKRKGFNVIGVVVNNKYQNSSINEAQQQHAFDTCQLLDIPLKEISLADDQWEPLNKAILDDYKQGFNPDLDILFTRNILTGSIYNYARNQSGADAVVYPFYARTDAGDKIDRFTDLKGMKLFKAVDQIVDDSFLLCQTPQKTLQRCIFPVGEFSKEVVRMIAESTSLDKIPESPKVASLVDKDILKKSLSSDIPLRSGKLINIVTGEIISHHTGFHKYHAGLSVEIDGLTYVVSEKDISTGNVYVADSLDHPSLKSDTLFTSLAYWIHKTPYSFYHEKQMMDSEFKMSSSKITRCSLTVGALNEYCGNDHIILSSSQPIHYIIPGHYCAFYKGEECIGSASILKPGPSHYAMNYKRYAKPKTDAGWKGLFQKFTSI